jgi:hypothetical protein
MKGFYIHACLLLTVPGLGCWHSGNLSKLEYFVVTGSVSGGIPTEM